jgi:hypothetical protein
MFQPAGREEIFQRAMMARAPLFSMCRKTGQPAYYAVWRRDARGRAACA